MHRQPVNRDTDFHASSTPHGPHGSPRWPALVLFGVAFGLVEAVLVVDLRFFLDPGGERFPLVSLPSQLLAVERVREAATLVLLASAAALSRACNAARFATFLFLFGLWDLAYYAALRIMLGWPRGLGDWDLLFLLPVPWLAPVYAPMLVAAVMMLVGGVTWRSEVRNGCFRFRARHVAAATLGAALCIWTFVGAAEARALQALPPRYPVEGLVGGLALALAGYVDAWRLNRTRSGRAATTR